ncbi:acyl-CoA thioester hydrolase/BAAT C-terminal domain-containing protein [Rheinheimera aquimaris]|uniref:Acyl-CoA thioester hydrolase/BAAT C-terminal domain-containing protein n=1 Tax=Rheinheimera aquimaris TaxID=412437 RepID=A0ABN1EA42_9GAMM|nr:acyl-CoA thioester hydrolase/BAAT C-terminal domain-containing protein [Rheinheimera aquimaris]MCB5214993.1 prolyl oligopeptidase family serine peptidase [Rheinheimera aquimaris]
MLKTIVKASLAGCLLLAGGVNAATTLLNAEQHGFVGHYYPTTSTEPQVAVLVLGGAEGGLPEQLAQPVVDAGYPTLALAYFNADGLPPELEKIPLEYFAKAKTWLQSQPNVKQEQLMIVGWSKGAELALLLASKDQQVSKVVAIAPSSVVWAGILKDWTKVPASSWTEQGQELTHVPFNPSGPVEGLRDLYSQSLANRVDGGHADIAVTNIKGKVVLLSGENDEIWPAPQMATEVCEKMNARHENQCEHLYYEGLGHLLDEKFLDKNDALHQTFINKLKAD